MAKKSAKQTVQQAEEVVINEKMSKSDQIKNLPESYLEKFTTKSALIRAIATEFGHDPENNVNLTSAISNRLNTRYQHVRNVLTQPLKRVETKDEQVVEPSDDVTNDEIELEVQD